MECRIEAQEETSILSEGPHQSLGQQEADGDWVQGNPGLFFPLAPSLTHSKKPWSPPKTTSQAGGQTNLKLSPALLHQNETRIERDTCTPMFIAALFTIARTWKQPRYPLADEWIRKLWYIYTVEYYSAIKKNAFESVLVKWMKLEPIIQSEVSQKEKHQYSISTHIYGIQKDGNDDLICETAKETQM